MNYKKGFTLVELLAVVAILSLLVIIALPNIIELFNEAKENSFLTECKQIYKTAGQQWIADSMFETKEQMYLRCKTCTGKELSLSGRKELDYFIKLDKAGRVVEFYATDGTYQYVHDEGELKIEDINGASAIAGLNDNDKITISNELASNIDTFCVNYDGVITDYSFEKGMTWSNYLISFYNTNFDEYHDHNINRGIVATKSGATSYCGVDFFNVSGGSVPITSQIISKNNGCYVYHDAGIC